MSQSITKMETIQAVDRAFSILEMISRQGSTSLADIQKASKINKASLSRLVYTLVENGYLEKNEKTGEYAMTLKTYEVGINAVQNLDKLSLINSTLADLSAATGRIAQFSIEDNYQLLCLQSIGQKTSTFSVYTNVGKRTPLYCTSAGKAILSAETNIQIMEKWNSFNVMPYTEHTITDLHQFLQEISEVRKKEYALDREESEYGLFCVGAVVMDQTGGPIGAISISGDTLTPEEEKSIAGLLLPTVQRLSALFGYVTRVN